MEEAGSLPRKCDRLRRLFCPKAKVDSQKSFQEPQTSRVLEQKMVRVADVTDIVNDLSQTSSVDVSTQEITPIVDDLERKSPRIGETLASEDEASTVPAIIVTSPPSTTIAIERAQSH